MNLVMLVSPVFIIVLILLTGEINPRPIVLTAITRKYTKYLLKYGWLESTTKFPDLTEIQEAVRNFQAFAGLSKTGEFDDETTQLMSKPRCGVRDRQMSRGNLTSSNSIRRRRYALQGSRWKVRTLTYNIKSYPDELDEEDVDYEIQRALNLWRNESNLSFRPNKGSSLPHIEFRFELGDHGDHDDFDGPGGTYAHAFFPLFGGDVHFDLDESWTRDSYDGINLFQVAAHEIGHALGLSHSKKKTSVMSPFYFGFKPNFELTRDDVVGIQTLYGKRLTKSRKTKTKSKIQSTTNSNNNDQSADIRVNNNSTTMNTSFSSLDKTTNQTSYFLVPLQNPVPFLTNHNIHHLRFFV